MRNTSVGHAVFAVTLIGIGLSGLIHGNFAPTWHSVPAHVPARTALAYLCAVVSLACGIGLLWRRSAIAARVLSVYLLLWLLLVKLPYILRAPGVAVWYESAAETMVLFCGAWALYAALATGWDKRRLGFAVGERGARLARGVYGVAMLLFGMSHFAYRHYTATLVPPWLPRHMLWVYFTGSAYLAAGVGVLFGLFTRLAATLSTVQMGLFTLLVWIPSALSAHPHPSTMSELVVSWALTAGGWVVADSCRNLSWLAVGKR